MPFYNKILNTYHDWIFGEDSIKKSIEFIKKGSCIIVVDDENRENEGDLITSSCLITPKIIAEFLHLTSGVICCSINQEKASNLNLKKMYSNNKDPNSTAFTTSIDYINVSTGISAVERSKTLNEISINNNSNDFRQPGHIFPLIAKDNGVIERMGHTEASIDFCKLANLPLSGTLCEIVTKDKMNMAKLDELKEISKNTGYPLTSIQDLICYRIKYNL